MSIAAIAAVLLSIAFVLYVLAGYPIALHVLAARRKQLWAKRFLPRTVSVILPVRNGEPWIRSKLQTLAALDYPPELIEIIVVSDGSTDRTEAILRSWLDARMRLLVVPAGGKALALNAGIATARGEILLLTDVRQTLDPDSLRHLVASFEDPAVGAVSGELMILEPNSNEQANVGLYWKYEKWIRINLSRLDSLLGATGAIYAIRRELVHPLPPGTLLDDVYLPLLAFFRGYRVVMEEKARAYDFPTSLNQEFRRKVRTLAGVYQIIRFFPALLSPFQNRMWIHFMSHKVGRLILPWALIVLLMGSILTFDPLRLVLLTGQAAFYSLALLDPVVSEHSSLKRLTSPVRTFVVLMAAALCAVSIWFRSAQHLWSQTRVDSARRAA